MIASRKRRPPIPLLSRAPSGVTERPLGDLASCLLMLLAIVSASLIDSPRSIHIRGTTLLGIITLVEIGIGAGALILNRSLPKRVMLLLAPYTAFMIWCGFSVAWAPPKTQGLQNAAVFLSFLVLATVSAIATADYRSTVERLITGAMVAADFIGLGLVAASVIVRGWPTNIDVTPWFVHPRALALFGLVPLSWHLARWALGNERDVLVACLWVSALFFSLSRTATATAMLLVLLASIMRAKRVRGSNTQGSRSQYLMFARVPVLIVGALSFAPFRARVIGSGARGGSISQLELRDNGRSEMWAGVMKSAAESPIIGKGLGTSESAVSNTYFWVGHPHNDFLRIYHDLGLIGLLCLISALALWWIALWRDWRRRAEDDNTEHAVLSVAALGALLSLVLGMLTDNSLVYGFVMSPTAVLIGAGLGAPRRYKRRKRSARRAHLAGGDGNAAEAPDDFELGIESTTEKLVVRTRRRRRL